MVELKVRDVEAINIRINKKRILRMAGVKIDPKISDKDLNRKLKLVIHKPSRKEEPIKRGLIIKGIISKGLKVKKKN